MINNITTEITNSLLFFAYGILCGIGYIIVVKIESHTKLKIVEYLLDCLFIVSCFVPFYIIYIRHLEGILYFYEIVFYILGLVLSVKLLAKLLDRIAMFYTKKCPTKIKIVGLKIRNILKK